ncbi:MAG: hypothetical protein PHF61_09440 [Bacteroidales bacterium]|nr:hypothetical protein [Bacteroidales bacterium]
MEDYKRYAFRAFLRRWNQMRSCHYYTDQAVDQVFEADKNYPNLLPGGVKGEETSRGHMMSTFMLSACILRKAPCKVRRVRFATIASARKTNEEDERYRQETANSGTRKHGKKKDGN